MPIHPEAEFIRFSEKFSNTKFRLGNGGTNGKPKFSRANDSVFAFGTVEEIRALPGGYAWLRLTGREGVKSFIREEAPQRLLLVL